MDFKIISWIAIGVLLSPAVRADEREKQSALGEPGELSRAGADAIVRERAEADRERKREVLAKMDANRAISRKVIEKGGRTVTMERIAPPKNESTVPIPVPVAKAVAENAEAERDYLAKSHALVSISATVYDRSVTEIHWWADGERRVAFSNIDFSLLRGVSTVKTDDTIYSFFMGIGEQERPPERSFGGALPQIPSTDAFPNRVASYIVALSGGTEADAEFLAGLDALHSYFRENERGLRRADQNRRALRAAHQRYREAHPEVEEDTLIQFWPKRGSAYGGR